MDIQKTSRPSKILKLDEHRPHVRQEVICLNCLHRWISVRPERMLLRDIQCPSCGETGAVICTGQHL